jgi:hypothetical protein
MRTVPVKFSTRRADGCTFRIYWHRAAESALTGGTDAEFTWVFNDFRGR